MADLTSVSPYFDDFDATKNYVKVLFKPGVAVQSRELTQSQSILQNQIKQVGDFLFSDADKVIGPKPIVNLDARNIRLNPLDSRGVPIDVNNFLGTYVTGGTTKDLIGYVEFVYTADDPDLGDPPSIVISLKKFNSTNNGIFGISDVEDLYFYIDYTDALNESTPNFKARTSTDITKNAISTVSPYSRTVTFTNPTTLISVGDLLVHPAITKPLYVVAITNTLEVVINTEPGIAIGGETISFVTKSCNPTSIVTQDVATFYKYGYFVTNILSKIVPDKTTSYPTKLIAFLTGQQIITSEDDPSLLDPAFESSNYFAAGADRLKIDLSLASVDTLQKSVSDYIKSGNTTGKDLIPLINFNQGDIEYLRELSVDSNLEKKLAERTYDESGSYIVDQFQITPRQIVDGNPNLYFNIGPGKAYVGGYPVKTVGTTRLIIPKSTKTETKTGYNINTIQGNYLKVANVQYLLIPPQHTVASANFLELHNVRNPANSSTRVGTVSFKNLEYDTSLGKDTIFKFFYNYYAPVTEAPATWSAWSSKYNIPSDEGQYIANILYTNNDLLGNYGPASTAHYGLFREPDVAGVASWWNYWNSNGRDIAKVKQAFALAAENGGTSDSSRILSNTKSYLQVINNSPFIDGLLNVQQVKSIVGVSNELTNQGTSATYGSPFFYADIADPIGLDSSNAIKVFDQISADKLVYPVNKKYLTTLRNIKTQYNKVYNNAIFTGGTYSKTLSAPETLALGDGTIPSSTARSNFTVLVKSGATANIALGPYNFEKGSVVVTGNGATVTFDLSDPSFTGIADISLKIQNDNTQIRTKTLVDQVYTIVNITAAEKEYDLARSDIFRFTGVYKLSNVGKYLGNWTSSASYNYNDIVTLNGTPYIAVAPSSNVYVYNTNTWNIIKTESLGNYVLDNGQRDNFYDHGTVKFIGGTSAIPGNVLITYSYFTHTGEGPLTVESYSSNIYGQIPIYRSVTDGSSYDLRDCLDFRPRRVDYSMYQNYNTAVIPISDVITEADVTYLIGRIDRLYVTNNLQNFNSPYNCFHLESGIASISPVNAVDNSDLSKLSIATITIPPYTVNAFDCILTYDDNRRYTMRDIGKIEKLAINLDKQVKLHAIEIANLKGVITNDNGQSLLKSGILVEDFTSTDKGDITSGTFVCLIDTKNKTCYPGMNSSDIGFGIIPTTSISKIGDIISMPYVEEVFASQLEANSIVNPNPAGINDGRGRSQLSRSNGRGVNLLLTGALLIAGYYAYQAGLFAAAWASLSSAAASASAWISYQAYCAELAMNGAISYLRNAAISYLDSIGVFNTVVTTQSGLGVSTGIGTVLNGAPSASAIAAMEAEAGQVGAEFIVANPELYTTYEVAIAQNMVAAQAEYAYASSVSTLTAGAGTTSYTTSSAVTALEGYYGESAASAIGVGGGTAVTSTVGATTAASVEGAYSTGYVVEGLGVAETGATAGAASTTAATTAGISEFFAGSWGVPQVAAAIAITYVAIKIAPEIAKDVSHVVNEVGKVGQGAIDSVNDLGNDLADIGGW
jgi:hypothetical protein